MPIKKIRVLEILRSPAGGTRRHVVDLLNGLDPDSFKVDLVTSVEEGDAGFERYLSKQTDSGPVIPMKINRSPGLADIQVIFKLKKLIQENDYDIIHGHGAKGGLYARLAGWLTGKKVVYTPHGGSVHPMFGGLKNLIYALIEKFLNPLTAKFVFGSKYSMDTYSRRICSSPDRSIVNYNGVLVDDRSPREVRDKFVVGALGILRPLKAHDVLIRAMALLRKEAVDCQAEIYGEGPEREKLEALIAELGLEDLVTLKGDTDNPDEALAKMDVLVQVSRFESFGLSVIEAMAQALPVIVSRVGGLPEIVEDKRNGLLVAVDSPEELAVAIEQLVSDRKLAKQLGEQGQESVRQKFSQELMVKGLEKIYRDLLVN